VRLTSATLARAARSGERQLMKYQAKVRRERSYGDYLQMIAPNRTDIVLVGASYK
jgi:hypothetical protein